jgi:hypothetical protein
MSLTRSETTIKPIRAKAAAVCERIAEKVIGAKVAWSYQAGIYYFTIDEAGTRFSTQFTEQFLLRKSEDDLEEEIHKIVERLLCETSQRPIRRAAG